MSVFELTHTHSILYGLSNILFSYLKNYRGECDKQTSDWEAASKNTPIKKIKTFISDRYETEVLPFFLKDILLARVVIFRF